MKIILSSTKSLNTDTTKNSKGDKPIYLKQAHELVDKLKIMNDAEFQSTLKLTAKQVQQIREYYDNWNSEHSEQNAKRAIEIFSGTTFKEIHVQELDEEQEAYAQKHVVILSGLYGILRPNDLIMPYRLEMGHSINGTGMKKIWSDTITAFLKDEDIINLASNEYSSAIKRINGKMITPQFIEEIDGKRKKVSVYAKQARGAMANWLIENKITDLKKITLFSEKGYIYEPGTTIENPVFVRKH